MGFGAGLDCPASGRKKCKVNIMAQEKYCKTQKEAAKFAGVTDRTIRRWEEKGAIEKTDTTGNPNCWLRKKGLIVKLSQRT